jgi:hypothetical protein
MAKYPDDKKLQDEIRAKMLYGEDYTVKQLYVIYLQVISIDLDLKYRAISHKSFGDKLRGWSSGEGSWLVGNGDSTYHKWQCHCSHLTREQLRLSAKRLYDGATSWWN